MTNADYRSEEGNDMFVEIDGVNVKALWNKHGGVEGVKALLRGDMVLVRPDRPWQGEEPMVIRFTVTSDGTTGAEWIDLLERDRYNLNPWSKDVLLSEDFKPTNGVTYDVTVLNGKLWSDNDRLTEKIRSDATESRKLLTPHPEVVPLILVKFSDEELAAMGLSSIVTMHEPIKDAELSSVVLGVSRNGEGLCLDAYCGNPDSTRWNRDYGFAFIASQVQT